MRPLEEIRENPRLVILKEGLDGGVGFIHHPSIKRPMTVVFSYGGGWDHVSVSHKNRTPTWEEMCIAKDIFFSEEECVIQYHPPRSQYVNNHKYVLHMWRPQNEEIIMPPKNMV